MLWSRLDLVRPLIEMDAPDAGKIIVGIGTGTFPESPAGCEGDEALEGFVEPFLSPHEQVEPRTQQGHEVQPVLRGERSKPEGGIRPPLRNNQRRFCIMAGNFDRRELARTQLRLGQEARLKVA